MGNRARIVATGRGHEGVIVGNKEDEREVINKALKKDTRTAKHLKELAGDVAGYTRTWPEDENCGKRNRTNEGTRERREGSDVRGGTNEERVQLSLGPRSSAPQDLCGKRRKGVVGGPVGYIK